jgi:hypothetical protein
MIEIAGKAWQGYQLIATVKDEEGQCYERNVATIYKSDLPPARTENFEATAILTAQKLADSPLVIPTNVEEQGEMYLVIPVHMIVSVIVKPLYVAKGNALYA